jgi:protein-tyrosine phosphatase
MTSLIDRIKSQLGAGKPVVVEPDYRLLFVCMGNICRSPTVEGVFRRVVSEALPERVIEIDSAGTHAYHVGEPPDPRAQRAALRRGVDLSALRARRITVEDFSACNLVLAMDPLNLATLADLCPPEYRERLRLLLEFAPEIGREDVPDPYYGGSNGFEYVLDLAEEAAAGLLAHVKAVLERR